MCVHCLFKALFLFVCLCVFEQAETVKSIKNTVQAIKNRGCRKSTTNRSGARFGMDLGVILGDSLVTNVCFCWTSECKKTDRKKVPPKVKQGTMVVAQGSQTALPKVKDCSNHRQQLNNKQQQFNNSTKTPTIAESLLQCDCCCLCFLFDFKFKGHDLTRPGQGPAN